MFLYKDIINIVLGFLLLFAMAYLLGTSILTLIDHKMTDISINMPKINLPKPILNVYLNRDNDSLKLLATDQSLGRLKWSNLVESPNGVESSKGVEKQLTGNTSERINDPTTKQEKDCQAYTMHNEKQTGGALYFTPPVGNEAIKVLSRGATDQLLHNLNVAGKTPKGATGEIITQVVQDTLNAVKTNETLDSRITRLIETFNTVNKVQPPAEQVIQTGGGTITNDNTAYYKHPSQMTPSQLNKFKTRAQFNKMSLADYKNWLSLFTANELANTVHAENYQRAKAGNLTMNDLLNLE